MRIQTELTNATIFLAPGKFLVRFVLSLIELEGTHLAPKTFWLLSIIAAILFWSILTKVAVALLKKCLGFGQRPQR